jgi:two-component system alkaline phosphatase synthesis response regulator PhoP
MAKKKILLIDDEPDILEVLSYNLEIEGFIVYQALNGVEGLSIAKKTRPDLIIVDVMMPEMDGIETCQLLREERSLQKTAIVFLTARSEEYSQIAGFEAGADDYIIKPVKPKILLSKIKAILKRSREEEKTTSEVKGLLIDREKYKVFQNGKSLDLPKKEFELLSLLTSQPGRVLTRDVILSKVWGDDIIVGNRTIDVHIRKLRSKLGDNLFKTVKGVGYKFDP